MNNLTSQNPRISRRGFTLIELLIVVGILAILATTVVLVLNPAELFKQARDSQRISDLKSVKSAIDLYLVRGNSPLSLGAGCVSGGNATPQWRISIANFGVALEVQPFISTADILDGNPDGVESPASIPNPRDVTGAGWISVPFVAISGNSPISKLPVDPVNLAPSQSSLLLPIYDITGSTVLFSGTPAYFYAYQCKGLTYEINANMESKKYSLGGSSDVESKDGGQKARYGGLVDPVGGGQPNDLLSLQIYEVGNDPGLDL